MADRKKRSVVYLEEALKEAKERLGAFNFAVIMTKVRAKSGGLIAAQNRREREEKGAYKKDLLGEDYQEYYGFYQAGAHPHVLEREQLQTRNDGEHDHLFLIDGVYYRTKRDGWHNHKLSSEVSDETNRDGEHAHIIILPAGISLPDGTVLEEDMQFTTESAGEHSHELQVSSTIPDGIHTHALSLSGGASVRSARSGEYWRMAKDSPIGQLPEEVTKVSPTAGDVNVPAPLGNKPRRKKKKPAESIYKEVPTVGPDDARIMFVSGSPSREDVIRGEPLIGSLGSTFNDIYLQPSSLGREDVAIANVVPNLLLSDDGRMRGPTEDEISLGRDYLFKEIDRINPKIIIALGKAAKSALNGYEDLALPHPGAIRRLGDKGELGRKLKQLSKMLIKKQEKRPSTSIQTLIFDKDKFDASSAKGWARSRDFSAGKTDITEESIRIRQKDPGSFKEGSFRTITLTSGVKAVIGRPKSPTKKNILDDTRGNGGYSTSADEILRRGSAIIRIAKADPEDRLVEGVVLDPYQVDAHNDWISPAEIEKTAHRWFEKSRTITFNHRGPSKSKAVGSYVVEYPSPGDRRLAIAGKPHKAFRKSIGDQTVHSGAWIITTELSKEDFASFQKGELRAYSIEGFGTRRNIAKSEMPEVKFVDVTEIKK